METNNNLTQLQCKNNKIFLYVILYELRIDSIDLIDLIKNGKLQNIGEKGAKFGYFWEP